MPLPGVGGRAALFGPPASGHFGDRRAGFSLRQALDWQEMPQMFTVLAPTLHSVRPWSAQAQRTMPTPLVRCVVIAPPLAWHSSA